MFEFEIWIFDSNLFKPFWFSCISPTHSYCHVSCMHHIVAHCLVMVVYRCHIPSFWCCLVCASCCCILFGDDCVSVLSAAGPALRSIVITLTKNRISASNHQASNQPFDHIDTIPLSRSCSLLSHYDNNDSTVTCCGSWTLFLCMTYHCHSK